METGPLTAGAILLCGALKQEGPPREALTILDELGAIDGEGSSASPMNTPWALDPRGKRGQVLKLLPYCVARSRIALNSKRCPPADPSLHAVLFSPPIIFGQRVDAAAPG